MYHNINIPPNQYPAPDNGRIFNIVCVKNGRKPLPYNPYGWPKDMQYGNLPNYPQQPLATVGKDMQYGNPPNYLQQPLATGAGNQQQQVVQSQYEILKFHFQRYDTNGDGRLSQAELRKAFATLGSRCPPLRAWLSSNDADKNGDGYINQQELDALIRYTIQWMDTKL
ncbi:hypothetical protein SLA2020_077230 [Shorea laevis]